MSTTLSVGILGLNRIGTSIGLALRRYVADGGRYNFEIVGYDRSADAAKGAVKAEAIDRSESKPFQVVADKDIVIMALSYDEVRETYQRIATDLKDGVVILDASPLKQPSFDWAKQYLSKEQHVVGISPILNPRYLLDNSQDSDDAAADLFDNSTILITPSVSSIKEAVDLAFNFCTILGSKPRFLDPVEHDALLTFTEGLPKLLGAVLFASLMGKNNWHDLMWLTNPSFGVLTRPLKDQHPDALRDEFLGNRDALVRALDDMVAALQTWRNVIATGDEESIEAALVTASEEYEKWINRRYRADWDERASPKIDPTNTMLGGLLGQGITKRIFGGKKSAD
jgi:prephenate dehydrogenase